MARTKIKGGYIDDGSVVAAHLHASHGITTNNIAEHSNNKYYTDARVDTRLAASKSTAIITTGNISIPGDAGKFLSGTGNDLQFYHSGSHSYVENYTGNLTILNNADDKDVILQTDDGSGGVTAYITLDGSAGLTQFDKNTKYVDSVEAIFGSSTDLRIAHDGTDSFMTNNTGDLYFNQLADDKDILFRADDGSGGVATYLTIDGSNTNMAVAKTMVFADSTKASFGAAEDLRISHDGTNSFLANHTGSLYLQQNLDDGDIIFQSDDGSGGVTTYFFLDGSQANTNFQKDIIFADSKKALFGGSGDLQIYHDGSNSYVADTGTGHLILKGTNMNLQAANGESYLFAAEDGAVTLYYDNVIRFATTSAGVSATGYVNATTGFRTEGASLLRKYASSWTSGVQTHDVIYNGWRSAFGDFTYVKAAGNGTSGHGMLIVGDQASYIGVSDVEQGTVTDDADNPMATTWAKFTSSALTLNGNIANSSGDMTIDVVGNITLDADGGAIGLNDGGTHYASFENSSNSLYIETKVSDKDIILRGNDGGSTITALTLDMSDAGTAIFNHDIKLGSSGRIGIGISPVEMLDIQSASGDARIRLDAPASSDTEIKFFNDGSAQYTIGHDDATDNFVIGGANVDAPMVSVNKSGNVGIGSTPAFSSGSGLEIERSGTATLRLQDSGNKSAEIRMGSDLEFVCINSSSNIILTPTSNVGIGTSSPTAKLHIHNTSTTSDGDGTADESPTGQDSILLYGHGGTNGQTYGGITWLGGSRRRAMISAVAENTDTDFVGLAFYTQGTDGSGDFNESMRIARSGSVGIGTTTPNYLLDVEGTGSLFRINSTSGAAALQISVPDTTSINDINFGDSGSTSSGQIRYRHDGDSMAFSTGGSEALRVDSSQRVGIGTTSPASTLDVSGDVTITNKLIHSGDTDTYMKFDTNQIGFIAGNSTRFQIQTSLVRFNQEGINQDFQIFGENEDNLFYVDASADNVGIGTNSPSAGLDIVVSSGIALESRTAGGSLAGYFLTPYNYVAKFESSDAHASIVLEDSNSSGNYNRIGVTTHDMHFTTNNSERMRIDSSGNVGIGTNSPSFSAGSGLEISRAGAATLRLEDTDGTTGATELVQVDADGYLLTRQSSSALIFGINSSEKMRLASNGYLGIGTSSPSDALHVGDGLARISKNNGTSKLYIHRDGSNPTSNTELGGIYFAQDYDASSQDWAKIVTKTTTSSAARTRLAFEVKSTSGNVMEGMSVWGTDSNGPIVCIGHTSPWTSTVLDLGADSNNNMRVGGTLYLYDSNRYIRKNSNDIEYFSNSGKHHFTKGAVQLTTTVEDGTSIFSTYNANTNPDAEQFYIEHNGSSVALGNKRNKLTLEAAGAIEFDAAGDIQLDVGNDTIELRKDGTKFGEIINSSNDLVIKSSQGDEDIIFKGVDSSTAITALTLDMSDAGAATFNNNVTAYSDERLKDNIETLDGSKVLDMRGVSFTRDGKEGSGVIAQELEKIAPELVKTADDEMGTKSVAYGNLVGYLIEAVKSQQNQIELLNDQIKLLIGENNGD